MSRRRPGSRHYLRLNQRKWAKIRATVLERDNWRCRSCSAFGDEVDHVTPLHECGEPYDEANLQTLCRTCHIAKTRRENERPDPARDAWRALVLELM